MDFFENVVKEKVIYGNQEILKDKEAFNIAFGIDKNYSMGMGVLMYSLYKNCLNSQIYHIFTDSLYEEDVTRIKKFADSDNRICAIIYYVDHGFFDELPTLLNWTQAMYYRLLIQYSIEDGTDRVLYLDSDILCLDDFTELFISEIDKIAMVVRDVDEIVDMGVKRLNLKKHEYFNSGMMLINLKRWKDNNISSKALEILHDGKYECDQDALNVLLEGKVGFLNRKFNTILNYDEYDFKNIVFAHIVGNTKPWHAWGGVKTITPLWLKYKDESMWKDASLIQPKTYKNAKKMSIAFRKNKDMWNSIKWLFKYSIWKAKAKIGRKKR